MSYEYLETSNDEVSKWLNIGKDILLSKLVRDNFLTLDQATTISEQYIVAMVREKNLTESIKKFLKVIPSNNKDNSYIIVTKL